MIKHSGTLPPDTLLEWHWVRSFDESREYLHPDRQYAVYRHNLMTHLGHTSAIHVHNDTHRVFPGCYDELLFRSVLMDCMNCYDEHDKCKYKEFSPCAHPQMRGSMLTSLRANAEYDPRFMIDDISTRTIHIMNGSI
jgi:hypothetical protein